MYADLSVREWFRDAFARILSPRATGCSRRVKQAGSDNSWNRLIDIRETAEVYPG
jgi:hypothetical protein